MKLRCCCTQNIDGDLDEVNARKGRRLFSFCNNFRTCVTPNTLRMKVARLWGKLEREGLPGDHREQRKEYLHSLHWAMYNRYLR